MRALSFLSVAANAAVLAGCLVAVAAVGAACSPIVAGGRSNQVATDATVEVAREPKLTGEPESEPEDLPGVDTSELNERERKAFWLWATQLYAPCADVAVSIATCVKEARACSACAPAARFLAERARAGADRRDAMAAFTVRFGADVKKVDLADSPSKGPEGAPVTIVVWSDFECPACGRAVPYLGELAEKFPEDVRLVHKLYPLRTHTHARAAARAALAAKKQGKYWALEEILFKNQSKLEDADLEGHAAAAGLDLKRFRKDFADEKAADEIIERDKAEADKHGLSGTPFILINGREFDLGLFRLDRDLAAWVAAEIEIRKKDAAGTAVAADAAATTSATSVPETGATAAPGSTSAPATTGAPAATQKP